MSAVPAAAATAPAWRRHLSSARRTFSFFFFLGRRSRKTKVFFLVSLLPVAMAAIIKLRELSSAPTPGELSVVFLEILMTLYLQFLVIILAIFYGTSIVSEELESKTLPYLTTRPLTKPGLLLGKYAAYAVLTAGLVLTSLACSYFVLNSRLLGRADLYVGFLRYAGVLALGTVAYLAVFALVGTVVKRSIFLGLVLGFGWENVISYFPGSTQRFSIVHYLKSLLPSLGPRGRFSLLMFRLEPTPPVRSVLTLLAIAAVALVVAMAVFRFKEYLFEE